MADVETARDPVAKVEWALRTFPRRVALTVSFGGGGLVLAHVISRLDRSVPVLFLDTGFHFPETLAFKDEFAARYGLRSADAAEWLEATRFSARVGVAASDVAPACMALGALGVLPRVVDAAECIAPESRAPR